jgi:hypothetical protein
MQVLQGRLFADPITGYNTMHPPWFHLVLAPFKALGLGLDFILIMVTVFNVALLIFFTYKVIETVFDRATALFTCLMITFIVEFMGCRNFLLATSFYFSLPFYVAGLWLYLKSAKSLRLSTTAAFLWGLAFLMSPVYVFLLGLTFLYEVLVERRYKRFLAMAAVFTVTIVPFFVQAIYIYSQGLWGSRVFALWRGVPELDWWGKLIVEFVSPTENNIASIPSVVHLLILITALVVLIRARKVHWFLPLSLLAWFLTFYHFSDQYAIRIQVLFSIFAVATAIFGIKRLGINKYLYIIPIAAIAVLGLYQHHSGTIINYQKERAGYIQYMQGGEQFWQNMTEYLEKDRYIFCNKDVYMKYIMPYFPAYSLGAYKTMDYFQLKSELSDMLEHDYQWVVRSNSYSYIDSIAVKYGIETAVVTRTEITVPLFEILAERWEAVYRDKYFVILKKPPKSPALIE